MSLYAGDGSTESKNRSTSVHFYSVSHPVKRRAFGVRSTDHVARLVDAGRMTPHGQRQVDAAKADGRWDAAYAPMRNASADSIPPDLRAAIEANKRASRTFQTLGRKNLFALTFRVGNMKTPAGRARKIAALVEILGRGESIVPEGRKGLTSQSFGRGKQRLRKIHKKAPSNEP